MENLSKVEVKGLEARFYDELISIASGFTYKKVLDKAIKAMRVGESTSIIDYGCGSAMALCVFLKYSKAQIVGLDIGQTMIKRALHKCKNYKNVKIFQHDIRKKTAIVADRVFISFVFHGFTPEDRLKIAKNAYDNLKSNGEFCILDYNEFDFDSKPFWFRKLFEYFECKLAFQFIKTPIKEVLRTIGFREFYEYYFYNGLVRLLIAKK